MNWWNEKRGPNQIWLSNEQSKIGSPVDYTMIDFNRVGHLELRVVVELNSLESVYQDMLPCHIVPYNTIGFFSY